MSRMGKPGRVFDSVNFLSFYKIVQHFGGCVNFIFNGKWCLGGVFYIHSLYFNYNAFLKWKIRMFRFLAVGGEWAR